jgi:hydroxymethylglutaryl-CoA reductase
VPVPRTLPGGFRKLAVDDRRAALVGLAGTLPLESTGSGDALQMAELLVENAVGVIPIPLGVATGFVVDGEALHVPMATEEASVIAAASYGARLFAARGGFVTAADAAIATVQIILQADANREELAAAAAQVRTAARRIGAAVDAALPTLVARGGGFRGLFADLLDTGEPGETRAGTLKVEIDVDVRDAMGANKVNTAGEHVASLIEELTGARRLMAIVTNASPRSLVRAQGNVAAGLLARPGWPGADVVHRIVAAAGVADADPHRAVTHNKGIMNGISAVALATGNDTRAVEAAAHGWAAARGAYQSLSSYQVGADGSLECAIELPLPVGTVGGAVDLNPVAQMSLRLLGDPSSRRLARIAAAVGLAQNVAALRALVTEGIQAGHMRLHAARLAFASGARGDEVDVVAGELVASAAAGSPMARTTAGDLLRRLRATPAGD